MTQPDSVELPTFTVVGTSDTFAIVKFTPSVYEAQSSFLDASVWLKTTTAQFTDGSGDTMQLTGLDGLSEVKLVAATELLGVLPEALTYRVDYRRNAYTVTRTYGVQQYRRRVLDPAAFPEDEIPWRTFKFIAPSEGETVDLDTVLRLQPDAPVYAPPAVPTEQDPEGS